MTTGSPASYQPALEGMQLINRGKVRDIYAVDNEHMLIVTSDRLSAFDVILPDPIPGKGEVLTSVSNFWFNRTQNIIGNHLTNISLSEVIKNPNHLELLKNRSIIVKMLKPLPVEAVVRGYLIGSGWKDYQNTGAICGIALPSGLRQAEQLPQPIFTPSTKAEIGQHDENIDFVKAEQLLGKDLAQQVRTVSLQIYQAAASYAYERGIIIADTKFEFGLDQNGKLVLIDEVLTPDSSRFWPVDLYRVGTSPPSFDKQFVRDYLETLDWNKRAPGPKLPDDIIQRTAEKYREAKNRLIQ